MPRLTPIRFDLFGNATGYRDELGNWCREQLEAGVFGHRLSSDGKRADGDKDKRLIYAGVALDLFICWPYVQEFGVLEVIRTGPAEFSRRLCHPALVWRACCRSGIASPTVCSGMGATRIETPDERAFFDAIGVE